MSLTALGSRVIYKISSCHGSNSCECDTRGRFCVWLRMPAVASDAERTQTHQINIRFALPSRDPRNSFILMLSVGYILLRMTRLHWDYLTDVSYMSNEMRLLKTNRNC